jgi:hypothetical protein
MQETTLAMAMTDQPSDRAGKTEARILFGLLSEKEGNMYGMTASQVNFAS